MPTLQSEQDRVRAICAAMGSFRSLSDKGRWHFPPKHITMPRDTVDSHQHTPSHRPHNCLMGKEYFLSVLRAKLGMSIQGTGRIHDQAVRLWGQNLMGSESVTAKEGQSQPRQVGLLPTFPSIMESS